MPHTPDLQIKNPQHPTCDTLPHYVLPYCTLHVPYLKSLDVAERILKFELALTLSILESDVRSTEILQFKILKCVNLEDQMIS